MNKTSFLSLVRQASNISDKDVAELEKLVVNFPYCQTAHLLIAKAAYDKGSMLSNQKLKKAAIYAANRQLLKKLIYTSDASVVLHPVEAPETVAETTEKVLSVPETPQPETTGIKPELTGTESKSETEIPTASTEGKAELLTEQEADVTHAKTQVPEETQPEITTTLPEELETALQIPEETLAPAITEAEPLSTEIPVDAQNLLSETVAAEIISPDLYEEELIAQEILENATEFSEQLVGESTNPEIEAETETLVAETQELEIAETENTLEYIAVAEAEVSPETEIQEEIPAAPETKENAIPETAAPEISVEVDKKEETAPEETVAFISEPATSLNSVPDVHELLLTEAPETQAEASTPASVANDELLHETLANFDQYLFRPEKESNEEAEPETDLKVVYAQDEIQQIYDNDALGYWMGSSRLGESLQLKNELTTGKPTEFHPELILEYSKTHELQKEIKPVSSNLSRQLEIIDEFLKMTPRLKAMANAKVKTEAQEDLSVKSSKINKNLATESLANIMVKQGKIKKAIKIYEHLILKIPEKKPYFVAQIEKLQNLE